MREHPIIFSGPMVRAILEGRKTQTRRVMRPKPTEPFLPFTAECPCPYGHPGDRLWVRETWRVNGNKHDYAIASRDDVFYRADESYNEGVGWKPSIHMPRMFSRLPLEVTGVRVERVQDISYADCVAEGIVDVARAEKRTRRVGEAPIEQFAALWDSINAKRGYSWESNPWVWVVEFKIAKRLEGTPSATR